MKPVAIFRHTAEDGPGHFVEFLDSQGIPWRLIRIDADDPIPASPHEFSGLAFMGGPMSVNDPLPWIAQEIALIRDADEAGIPVIGHCLGGQLMAKAFGESVTRNPVKEIGWGRVTVVNSALAQDWLGDLREFLSFHWHGETFGIPEGATRILQSGYCANQAFVRGPHLGMQCHVEMTAEIVQRWCESGVREIAACRGQPSVQSVDDIQRNLDASVAELNFVADRLYTRWINGL